MDVMSVLAIQYTYTQANLTFIYKVLNDLKQYANSREASWQPENVEREKAPAQFGIPAAPLMPAL